MTQQVVEPTSHGTTPADTTDLLTSVQQVLRSSEEPLTLSKIRAKLPVRYREVSLEELTELLNRQVAAQTVHQFPKYRSQQDRYWDRPMPVHVAALLKETLAEGPLGWSELRRKLPAYAQTSAEQVLQEQVAGGQLHRHPRVGRGSERFGASKPDPREYLRTELAEAFERLAKLGFDKEQLRTSALELLHEEEWSQPATPAAPLPATPAPDTDTPLV